MAGSNPDDQWECILVWYSRLSQYWTPGVRTRRTGRAVVTVFRRFMAHDGLRTAASLTYTTLFAVVPLTTVLYAMLSAVPSFQGVGDQLQTYVFQQFLPATGEVVLEKLTEFSSQARQLTAFGVGFLFVTSLLMMYTIEQAFNQIWQVTTHRRGLASFVIYWAVLTLGPFLIGAGFALSSYLASLRFFNRAASLFGGQDLLLMGVPPLLSLAAFFFLYMAVPSTRVRARDAALGALFMAIAFEAARFGFSIFVGHFTSYQVIYGAFAAVPLFLLWVYLSWSLVLAGAEITALLGESSRADWRHWSPFWQSLGLLWRLDEQRKSGGHLSLGQVRRLVGGHYRTLMASMVEQGWVVQSNQGGWVLARSLDELPLSEVIEHIGWTRKDEQNVPDPRFQPVQQALAALALQRSTATRHPLNSYFHEHDADRNITSPGTGRKRLLLR
ncbi:YihY family inner membrane protein [Larsenimonas rhizosphaerae]|uniref:YihY family inner membrane protein n=1 Tax=Larsenimonas rhizosphaerae TaxID=2944682 RepID=UPI002033EF48|nr:YihY family inner membrane protein [Larsenimonas rhizosphaerae]MCM2130649.1 YihY family inner membrane protein [Larsenimonas rhizosphaerae]